MHQQWSDRADSAEEAVVGRHLRRLWAIPGTALGVVAWPAVRRERLFFTWHYWWQAHLIECLADAALRGPTPLRRARLARVARTHRLRNLRGWTNDYYDDMAWLGIALERVDREQGIDRFKPLQTLESEFVEAADPSRGGAVPWRRGDDFYNAPANGPVAIFLARRSSLWRAQGIADWIDENLRDAETGLIVDGVRADGRVERNFYTYCQGVVLGAEVELAVHRGAPRHAERVRSLVAAVERHHTVDGIVSGASGGDGGLFNGVLVRYLAMVAAELPGDTPEDREARRTAARIVLTSADAAWTQRLQIEGLPLFGHDWSERAELPSFGAFVSSFADGSVDSSETAERDLSVQLSGWILMEAAARVASLEESCPRPG